ncbi:MAG: hypothetical protein K5849_07050 [Bacteroidales bacterium]|nr:hypothetical protein [Bacteroidales bacterium]
MKNIFKSIFVLGAAAALAVSCNVDNIGTTFENSENNAGVSFLQSTISNTEISATQTSFDITLGRRNSDGSLTVSLESSLPSTIGVPSSVTFAAGEASATITLDLSAMVVGTAYKGSIAIVSDETDDLSKSEVNCVFQKAYTWEQIGTGTYTYNPDCLFSGSDPGLPIYKAVGLPVYKIANWCYGVDFLFTLNSDNTTTVHDQYIGYTHSTYGKIYIDDVNDYAGSTAFPSGEWDSSSKTYTFYVIYYDATGPWGYGFESFEMD